MAIQTKTIKSKMTSVKNIGKITKAMEMISISKMKKSAQQRLASGDFAKHSFELLENMMAHKNIDHPLMEQRSGNKTLMLIIASNKGLCGGYNMNVSKQVSKYVAENTDREIDSIVIGKQSAKIAGRNGLNILAQFNEFSDTFSGGKVATLLNLTLDTYKNDDQYSNIVVVYTEFISSISYEPAVIPMVPVDLSRSKRILEIKESKDGSKKALYQFEPTEEEVLDAVIPQVLLTVLHQLLLESLASEHSARVTAMRNATDNAAEMLEDLKINYNRARQAAVTQEIAEIVGGASAMS